jgi:leucyl aminopeptidase (aminopeptidase T)
MYLDAQSTLTLYKVNLQFSFRLCDLLRENALRWSEAGNRAVDACAAELESATTRMLDAGDWNSLAFISNDLYWKALQLQTRAVQQLSETTLGNQTTLSSATQEAVSAWQKEASAALKETTGAMPISTTLQDYLQDYLHLLSPEGATSRRKSSRNKSH